MGHQPLSAREGSDDVSVTPPSPPARLSQPSRGSFFSSSSIPMLNLLIASFNCFTSNPCP